MTLAIALYADIRNFRDEETSECTLTSKSVYNLEAALVFQDMMRNFTVHNYSIGYEIYSGFAKCLTYYFIFSIAFLFMGKLIFEK